MSTDGVIRKKYSPFGLHPTRSLTASVSPPTNATLVSQSMLRPLDLDHLRYLASSIGHSIEPYLVASYSPATLRPYKRYLRIYQDWCAANACAAVPADHAQLVRFFLFETRRSQKSTLLDMLWAIQHLHVKQGYLLDLRPLRSLINGYVNSRCPPIRRPGSLDVAKLRKIVGALPTNVRGLRDRALLALGFAAALRPSELVGLDVGLRAPGGTGSIFFGRQGMRIVLHTSKSDHQRRGMEKLIVYGCDPCPIAAVQSWLRASHITDGAIFRRVCRWDRVRASRLHVGSVATIVRRSASMVGGPEAMAADSIKSLSGYSLRAGFVSSAIEANVDARTISQHMGWANASLAVHYARRTEGADKTLVAHVLSQTSPGSST
jgi:site-specific recombinase XerD